MRSKAQYIMLSDQDDVWLPTKVEKSLNALKELEQRFPNVTPLLVHTDLKVVDESLISIADSFWMYAGLNCHYTSLNRLLVQNVITGCTIIFNRALAEIATPIPNEALMHDHWLGLVASALGHIGVLEEATILYRQHGRNIIGAKKWRWNIENLIIKGIKALLFAEGKNQILEYRKQAKALYQAISPNLTGKEKEILESFVTLEEKPYLRRISTLLKFKLLKGNWVRNIALILRS